MTKAFLIAFLIIFAGATIFFGATQFGLFQYLNKNSSDNKQALKNKQATAELLSGRIYDVRAAKLIEVSELFHALKNTPIVMIGGHHDNLEHHKRQNQVIQWLADRNRYPVLALEILEPRQSLMINRYRKNSPEIAGDLGSALQWQKFDLPSWEYYAPLFQSALSAKLELIGADLPRAQRDSILKSRSRKEPPDAKITSSWKNTLKVGGCEVTKDQSLSALANLQWQRDRSMSAAIGRSAGVQDGVVLLSGRAHIRRDRGVPYHLLADIPAISAQNVLSLALTALVEGQNNPIDYLPKTIQSSSQKTNIAYDYIWFTPTANGAARCPLLYNKR